jgi:membrane associated rhomboid family serine protease
MSDPIPVLTFALVGVNAIFSYKGFKDSGFMNRFKFETGPIRAGDYQRLVTSGFLHVNGHHLFFNMFALFCFGEKLELLHGATTLTVIYLLSLLGGSFLSLLMHRNHYDYSAVGASGAVSGLVFATVFLAPEMGIGLIFLPVAYTCLSIWGIKKQWGNIGHDAHLGGAITGMLVAVAVEPEIVMQSLPLFLIILSLFSAFLIGFWYNPMMLKGQSSSPINIASLKKFTTRPPKKTMKKTKTEDKEGKRLREEMDELLAKIHEFGMDGLTAQERGRLEVISQKLREGK